MLDPAGPLVTRSWHGIAFFRASTWLMTPTLRCAPTSSIAAIASWRSEIEEYGV